MSNVEQQKPKKRGYISLALAVLIGLFFVIYTLRYVGNTVDGITDASSGTVIGTSLAVALATPHLVLLTAACIFSCVALLFRQAWAALVSGILYIVALVLMIPWFYDSVAQIVLCFFAYGRMRKDKA